MESGSVPLSPQAVQSFQTIVRTYYQKSGRHDLLWRKLNNQGHIDPYHVLVSEIMLQQTQVSRVTPKYILFLEEFPTLKSLAQTELAEVLKLWSGLGYNRRAQFLWRAAQRVVSDYAGRVPDELSELVKLPGVGANTAGAILAYGFNKPTVFIETNIRTVYLHYFFQNQNAVADSVLLPLIEQTIDTLHPREWYWALMDYGSYLKATVPNPSKRSKHHIQQTKFEGSKRQLRGQVLKALLAKPQSLNSLQSAIVDERLTQVLDDLTIEGLVSKHKRTFHLGK